MHARNRTWPLGSNPAERCRQRTLPVEGGDGSTLTLDFTTGVLDPRLTFTRTSTATFINASGLVATASANTPRFDHDPTTLAPRGLLIEGSATNLFNWSETFDTTGGATNWNWSVNVTRGTVTTTNPTGASATVIKVEETTTNGVHAPLTTVTVLASTNYTFSVWAKAVERTFVQLLENGGSGANSMVNLSTGAIVSESTAGITTVTALGTTGWYRISMRLTTIVGQTTANCQLRLSTNGTTTSYAGTTGSGIYIWGAQLETGSGASSYIPTGASQVTRTAENCTMPTSSFITGSPYPNTLYVDAIPNTPSAAFVGFARLFDRVTNYAHGSEIYYYSAASMIVQRKINASANTERSLATALTYGSRHKFAMSIDASSFLGSYDGVTGLGTTTAPAALPTSVTHLGVGCAGDSVPAGVMFGTIRQIKFWPTALPQATINALTTL